MSNQRVTTHIGSIKISILQPHAGAKWVIRTRVGSNSSPLSKECFTSLRQMSFHGGESSLKQDDEGIYLEWQTTPLVRYTLFRSVIKEYLIEAKNWMEAFQDSPCPTL